MPAVSARPRWCRTRRRRRSRACGGGGGAGARRGGRAAVAADRALEVRGADLLLELPEEVHVERDVVIDRVLRAEQRGERGPLVVGRAAAEVAIAAPGEAERIAAPLRLARGLHVE